MRSLAPKRAQHCNPYALLDRCGGWIRREPFAFLFFLTLLFASLMQSGCVGLTTASSGSPPSTGADLTPLISTQPTSQTVIVGQKATFSVIATGSAPLSYRWQKNGAAVSGGATSSSNSYTTPAETILDSRAQFTVVVSNSAGSTTSSAATLTVIAATASAPLQIATSSLPSAEVGIQFQTGLSATGGVQPYHWSIVSGTLPQALSLNPNTGALAGTASEGGKFDFSIQVSDSSSPRPQTAMKALILSVVLALQIAPGNFPNGRVGVPFQSSVNGIGGVPPYSWSIVGALPSGLTLKASSGSVVGTPTQAGTSTFMILLADSAGQSAQKSSNITIAAAAQAPAITTTTLPQAVAGQAYSAALQATGGTPPYTWSLASGQLPEGLTLNATGGQITGAPTKAGTSTFAILITDSAGQTAQISYSITVAAAAQPPVISTTTLPQAVAGQAYSAALQATGGTPPYTWSLASGQLPAGLTLNATSGQIGGIPGATGQFSFVVQVTDASSSKQTATQPLVLTVTSAQPSGSCGPPNYCARTDVNPQPYPSAIPCPSATGCSGGGTLSGQGYCFTPSDFATQICRVTDQTNTPGSQHNYLVDCGGSAESNVMNLTDTRVALCDTDVPVIFSFNGGTTPPTITPLYAGQGPASDGLLGGCSSNAQFITTSPFFSFAQTYIAYAESFLSNGNPAICAWNFASTTTMPTYSNGGVTSVVDLSSCVSAMAGLGYGHVYVDDITVSADDQTFAALGSTTTGQGSSGNVYVIVWNRTNGCRVWNTSTATISGAWGATGSTSLTDEFVLHNVRLSKNGNYLKVTQSDCLGGGCTSTRNTYVWNIATLTVNAIVNDATNGCGHNAIGWLNTINLCGGFWTRPFSSNDQSGSNVISTYPTGQPSYYPNDGHAGFTNGNATDTNPVMWSVYAGSFTPVYAWDNEIIGVRLDGSGVAYRFAHTYITGLDTENFGAEYGIGGVSQDGKYYIWPSDWDGMLGRIGGGSSTCTIGTNCRADVFLVKLQ